MLASAIKILGFGLSGLGFLLMYLAYNLLQQQGKKHAPSELIVKSINRYIAVCLIMTVIVGGFTLVTSFLKQDQLDTQAATIEKETDDINTLVSTQRVKLLSDSITKLVNTGHPEQATKLVQEQQTALNTLSKSLKTDTGSAASVEKAKGFIVNYPAMIQKEADPAKKDSLSKEYIKFNNQLLKASISKTAVK